MKKLSLNEAQRIKLVRDIIKEEVNNIEERRNVIRMIQNGDYEVNNYNSFVESMLKSKHISFLTKYSPQDYQEQGIKTFKLKGYDIGFAIKPDGDIISVHNNSNVRNISDYLLQSAISLGGTKLDHFEGKLSDIYDKQGFKEIERYKWDDQYAPEDWDYEKYGRPDVIMRQL